MIPMLVIVTLAVTAADPSAGADLSYVYLRGEHGALGTGTVEADLAAGTREVRPFGASGVESGARFRINASDRIGIDGWGGALFTAGAYRSAAWSAEATALVLDQAHNFVNLSVGAGFMRDFRAVSIPRARATVGRTFGRLDASLSGLVELPQSARRDGIDVIAGAAASYRVTQGFAAGAEVTAEDLEGLWNPSETEGGAKLVAGPTLWWRPSPSFHIKANAAAVATTAPAPVQSAVPGTAPAAVTATGFLGRFIAGYDF